MKRFYYLTGNIDSTEQISKDLHQAGIADWHFHVLGKDEAGLYRRRIPMASFIQTRDVIRHGERGALLGLMAASILILWILTAEPFGPHIGRIAYVTVFGFVTMFGAWVGGLTGLETENGSLAPFGENIDHGEYLILIDVSRGRENTIRNLMSEKHPEARLMRVGSTLISPLGPAQAGLT